MQNNFNSAYLEKYEHIMNVIVSCENLEQVMAINNWVEKQCGDNDIMRVHFKGAINCMLKLYILKLEKRNS